MADKTQKEKIDAVYQAVVGFDGNPDDNGMIGDIKEIKEHLVSLNGKVAKNTTFRKIGTWLSCAMFTGLIAVLVKLIAG